MAASEDKILIVDDQPLVRFSLRSLLEGEGYRVLAAVIKRPQAEVSEAELLAFCQDKLARYKIRGASISLASFRFQAQARS